MYGTGTDRDFDYEDRILEKTLSRNELTDEQFDALSEEEQNKLLNETDENYKEDLIDAAREFGEAFENLLKSVTL